MESNNFGGKEPMLNHRDHDLEFEFKEYITGGFLSIYCNTCSVELGNLNITFILNSLENNL